MSNNDINKINMTGGDILAYRPSVSMSKEIKTSYTNDSVQFTEIEDVSETLAYYSKPVKLMSESLPNRIIVSLKNNIINIESYLDTLEKSISLIEGFHEYKDAKLNGDIDTVDEFMDYHFNDINGSTKVEVYDNLQDLKKESIEFMQSFAKITYGDKEIDTEYAKDLDNVKMQRLYDLENTDSFNKINYAAINSDIQINKISSAFVGTIGTYASNLYIATLQGSYDEIEDSDGCISDTIKKAFDNAVIKSSQDRERNNLTTNTKMVEGSLINAVNGRNSMLNALNTKSKLQDLPSASDYIKTISKAYNDANEKALTKMVDYNKSILLSSLNKDDNINSIKEKGDLRNIFCSIK